MKINLASFVVGVLFAFGLGLGGMTQPQKVIGFLDVFGAWDPSLIFVMGGALLIHAPLYWMVRKGRRYPVLTKIWHIPTSRVITPQLVIGAAIFGTGWGLGGYCPAPVIVSLASLTLKPLIFVVSMIVGMLAYRLVGLNRQAE